ncbi:DUF6783 domain-containing protein [Murimonas intestini]|uniref:DUF6783 domain-containing protein n=1 Tax=Murimonas intestini TaxID=1337051 RepID=UPI002FE6C167
MKIYSLNLFALLCGIFVPLSVSATRCTSFIRNKFPTKSTAHFTVNIFSNISQL